MSHITWPESSEDRSNLSGFDPNAPLTNVGFAVSEQ